MIFEPRSHPLERSESGQQELLRAPGGAGIFDEGENAGARSRGGHQGAEPPKEALLRAPGGAGIFDEGEHTGARSRGGA